MKRNGLLAVRTVCAAAVFVVGLSQFAAAEPVLCPRTYLFNDPEWVATSRNNHDYLFKFTFEWGDTFSPLVGAGRYDFGIVVSDDLKATLTDAYILATCNRILVPIPPFAEPQPVIVILETDWGYGTLKLNFTPPSEESDDCYWAEEGVDPSRDKPAAGSPRANTVSCTGGNTQGGGGETITFYCLFYDYYDPYGSFLYSVLQYCWEEPT